MDTAAEHWARLEDLLRTDPGDPSCDTCRLHLGTYAEIAVDGGAAARLLPPVAAHLESCRDCREDLEGLIDALSHQVS